jgi:predicted kinase
MEALQWDLAQRLLTIGVSVLLESGFWSREERERFRASARDLGASTKIHFLDVPREELHRRLAARNAALPEQTVHVAPADLDGWITLFEPPTRDELEQG